MTVFLAIVIPLGILILAWFFLKKPLENYLSKLTQRTVEESVKLVEQKSKEVLREERERIHELVDSKLKFNDQSLQSKDRKAHV